MSARTQASTHRLVEELWEPESEIITGIPKRARQPVRIRAYVPAPLAGLDLTLDARLVQAVSDAQEAVAAAQRYAESAGIETVAQQLLRSEAIASSQIEGIEVPSHRALAKAQAGNQHRPSAQAALANIEAVKWVYGWASSNEEPFSVPVIRRIHERLAAADRHLALHAGTIRTRQNWIGHDPHTPAEADFVPPPARFVDDLLEDLCAFCNRTDLPPLLQAAAAHVQFETIHPFVDGNGRVGRSLIGAILCRREICREVVPPISLVLSRDRDAYVEALMAWRLDDAGAAAWIDQLARATEDAALASTRFASQVAELQETWLAKVGRPRRDSAAAAIIAALPASPILSSATAAQLISRSESAARAALTQLEESGVVAQVTVGKRNRMWESVGLFALVDEMERELSVGARGPARTQ